MVFHIFLKHPHLKIKPSLLHLNRFGEWDGVMLFAL